MAQEKYFLARHLAQEALTVTARKDDASFADQANFFRLAGLWSLPSGGGGLIHTTSG
jgi:hypothetical protein